MASRLRSSPSRIHIRRCVCCGYDGVLLKGGRTPRCPRCGCDLRSRPARSYAEMEGLAAMETRTRPCPPETERRVVERWLLAATIAVVAVIAAVAAMVRLTGA